MTAVVDRWAPAAVRYVVCGLPDGHRDWDHFAVSVTLDAADRWTVRSRTSQVSRHGIAQVMLPDDDWEPFLMPLQVALDVAAGYARRVDLRGRTADDIVREETRDA